MFFFYYFLLYTTLLYCPQNKLTSDDVRISNSTPKLNACHDVQYDVFICLVFITYAYVIIL